MTRNYIPKQLRAKVAKQARYRCGYCLTSQTITGATMEIDHLVPGAKGGKTEENNLWLACSDCNDSKNDRINGLDTITNETVALFNPRQQIWEEHFVWTNEGDVIIGLTATGRATVEALKLNRQELVIARRRWVGVGWHPPKN